MFKHIISHLTIYLVTYIFLLSANPSFCLPSFFPVSPGKKTPALLISGFLTPPFSRISSTAAVHPSVPVLQVLLYVSALCRKDCYDTGFRISYSKLLPPQRHFPRTVRIPYIFLHPDSVSTQAHPVRKPGSKD